MCIEKEKLLLIFGAILVLYIIYMLFRRRSAEHFDQRFIQIPIRPEIQPEIKPDVKSESRNAPKINPQVGSIIDGPGFEAGDVDGVDQAIITKIPSDYYFLDDGADGKYSITSNLFSVNCCSSQWPVPFHQKYDPYVCKNKSEYVGSNIFGNNTFQDAGCACLTKDQAKFLYTRGTNGSEWF
jgi:hypothetical protein